MAPKILIILTSADKIGPNDHKTGWYLPELAHPYDVLAPKADLVFASPKGGPAPVDPTSVQMFKDDASSAAFLKDKKSLYENTVKLSTVSASDFDAVFVPGGHGPMVDLAIDADSIRLISELYTAGKPVAAVCHGPAAFTNVKINGEPLLKNKEATGFTNAEEDAVQLSSIMPFMLETKMREVGAKFVQADEAWGEKVVTDGLVITGQNPNSAKGIGEALAKALGV